MYRETKIKTNLHNKLIILIQKSETLFFRQHWCLHANTEMRISLIMCNYYIIMLLEAQLVG